MLAAPPARSASDDGSDPEPRNAGFCSATARLLFAACGVEARDDHLIAKAKCINVADPSERSRCLDEAAQARADTAGVCQAQLDWRRAGCGVLGEARYDPAFEPDRFDSDFRQLGNPNPYFPLGIGNRWEYRGGSEYGVVEVTRDTKLIAGVTCAVVRDLVHDDGRLVEATDDWFAAGRDGSTWYCGEEVKDYASFEGDRPRRAELISIDGSFKHGRDRDKAGIVMPARPTPGMAYREEFSLGNAEDVAEVLTAAYAHGADPQLDRYVPRDLALRLCNRDCVVTKNYSLLEAGVIALKYYARGIGFFLETKPDEGQSLQLVGCNFDARCVALPVP